MSGVQSGAKVGEDGGTLRLMSTEQITNGDVAACFKCRIIFVKFRSRCDRRIYFACDVVWDVVPSLIPELYPMYRYGR